MRSILIALLISPLAMTAAQDYPNKPVNPVATLCDDYTSVTVSWECPGEVGEFGGHIDVSKLTYYIFDAFGSVYDPAIAVTTDTHYTFDYSALTEQDFVAYQITAGIGDYYSVESSTNIVCVGAPSPMPFSESFAGRVQSHQWAFDKASSYTATTALVSDGIINVNAHDPKLPPLYLDSQDGDNGMLYIKPTKAGDMLGIMSVKISMQDAVAPSLDFFRQGKGGELDVMVSADGGEFATVATIDMQAEASDGWTPCHIDLSEYTSAAYIQIELRLRAVHNSGNTRYNVAIDNITVSDDTGLAPFTTDDGYPDIPVEIYTLSGTRLPSATPPAGLYIMRRGSRTVKTLIR